MGKSYSQKRIEWFLVCRFWQHTSPNGEEDSSKTILQYLKTQNEDLRVEQLKVLQGAQQSSLITLLVISVDISMAQKLKRHGSRLSYKFGDIQLYLKEKHNLILKVTNPTIVKALSAKESASGSMPDGSSQPMSVPVDSLLRKQKLLVNLAGSHRIRIGWV